MKCQRTLFRGVLFYLVLVTVTTTVTTAFAASPSLLTPCRDPAADKTAFEIPTPLKKPKPLIPQGCERPFFYHGELYSADSPDAHDAANLKYVVQSVPEANSILDEYQSNRAKSRISAYSGTFGIFLMFFAARISRIFNHGESNDSTMRAFKIGGGAIAAGSFLYSFTLLQTNEYLIPKAVDTYNLNKTDDPIELRFSAGWSF